MEDSRCRFIIKPLSTKSFTGELEISPGRVYTLGRAKCCDILFRDGRVSRKMCQIIVCLQEYTFILYNGVIEGEDAKNFISVLRPEYMLQSEPSKKGSTVFMNGENIPYGSRKVVRMDYQAIRIKLLSDIGFTVEMIRIGPEEEMQQHRYLREIDVNTQGTTNSKRIKYSVDKLLSESRTLRYEVLTNFTNQNKFHNLTHRVEKRVTKNIEDLQSKLVNNMTTQILEKTYESSYICMYSDRVKVNDVQECKLKSELVNELTTQRERKTVQTVKEEDGVTNLNADYFQAAGSGLCLNRLMDVEPMATHVEIMDLLSPVELLEEIFVATFTADILWFLSSTRLPNDLPVTVACHDYERCWSSSITDRIQQSPYPEWPNLKILYPAFPVLCRTNDKSRMRGVGCHHPKLFLLKRKNSIRVIVTSANLNYRQWFQVSNTVWWQDFPRQHRKDYGSLFRSCPTSMETTGDFAAQLAAFISCLVKDVPSESHWAIDLVNYDFSKASVSIVSSVPGFHELPLPRPEVLDKFLGTVSSSVVGICHRFHPKADSNGARLRKLFALVNSQPRDHDNMIQVILRRMKDLSADPNAVSISACSKPHADYFLEQDDLREINGEELQIGFLPRHTAAWVATLCDSGICKFKATLQPKGTLAFAAGQTKNTVQLALYVYEGPKFSELSSRDLNILEYSAFSNVLRMIQRNYGLWRLQEVLSKHKWPDSAETEFVYCSSAIGTSLNSKFLASFSSAAGRKAVSDDDSYESDPEWGCWTAASEQAKPSIQVLFPTIDCLRTAKWGPSSFRGVLCFAERTWERLKPSGLLYNAVPYPASRVGIPMHVKVARRRFQSKCSKEAFGWIYSGSHNFSPAAWGKCANKTNEEDNQQHARLHICNYELGIIFMEPPTAVMDDGDSSKRNQRLRFDEVSLPFLVPAPEYCLSDRPATGKAIFELVQQLGEEEKSVLNEGGELDSELPSEESVQDTEEDDTGSSGPYSESLWNQLNQENYDM